MNKARKTRDYPETSKSVIRRMNELNGTANTEILGTLRAETKYIHDYLSAWLKESSWSNTQEARSEHSKHHQNWEFYIKKGFYASEDFYAEFLGKKGLAGLPTLLRVMDFIQENRKSIFQTDDDPRQVPFPPAFQAAFVKIAEELAVSDDIDKRRLVKDVFLVLRELGMSRIHQSAEPIDYHVLPIKAWISFLERTDTEVFSRKKVDVRESYFTSECVAAYVKSWIQIYLEMEEWAESDWPFSPENESIKADYASDWMHTLRRMGDAGGVDTGVSSCVYTRCLETTDIRWLPYLFAYIYENDQYRVKEYFPFAFEKALAKYCRHSGNETQKPEFYKSLVAALRILNKYYGMTILRDDEKSFISVSNRRSYYMKKPPVAPSLETYSRCGICQDDFNIEWWIKEFTDLYNIVSEKGSGTDSSPCKESDPAKERSTWMELKDWLNAGWRVYRDQLSIRLKQLEGYSNAYKFWCDGASSLFFGSLIRTNGIFMSAFWGWVLCYFIKGVWHIAEFNYWVWLGATIGTFIFRELRILYSCCRYRSMMNKDDWKKDEASYLDECCREYCLNDFGGMQIKTPAFSFAAHSSVVMSRLIGWIGPVLEAYGDSYYLLRTSGILRAVQNNLFRDALPHKGKEWPRPPKKPEQIRGNIGDISEILKRNHERTDE